MLNNIKTYIMSKLNTVDKIYTEKSMFNAFKAGQRMGAWEIKNNYAHRIPNSFKQFMNSIFHKETEHQYDLAIETYHVE